MGLVSKIPFLTPWNSRIRLLSLNLTFSKSTVIYKNLPVLQKNHHVSLGIYLSLNRKAMKRFYLSQKFLFHEMLLNKTHYALSKSELPIGMQVSSWLSLLTKWWPWGFLKLDVCFQAEVREPLRVSMFEFRRVWRSRDSLYFNAKSRAALWGNYFYSAGLHSSL